LRQREILQSLSLYTSLMGLNSNSEDHVPEKEGVRKHDANSRIMSRKLEMGAF
jgi:hypothetical protein